MYISNTTNYFSPQIVSIPGVTMPPNNNKSYLDPISDSYSFSPDGKPYKLHEELVINDATIAKANRMHKKESIKKRIQEKSQDKIDNFHKVDNKLYRGAAPDEEGLRYLKKLGVKTIIDFRRDNSRESIQAMKEEKEKAEALGIKYVNIPLNAEIPPTQEEIIKFLEEIDSTQGKVFIHCKGGKDRTGIMTAVYRVLRNHMSKEEAYEEMIDKGFTWDHQIRYSPLKTFLENFNPDNYRQNRFEIVA